MGAVDPRRCAFGEVADTEPHRGRNFDYFDGVSGCGNFSAAGLWPNWPRWTGWAALGIAALSTVLNLITPSKAERMLWGPVTVAMLVLALVVMVWG